MTNADYFRITECGSYFLKKLIRNFVYLDSVWMDTPIADIDLVYRLRQSLNDTTLNGRLERTRLFLDYLEKMEKNQLEKHPEHQASPLGKFKFVKNMKSGFKKDEEKVFRSLRRKYRYY